MCLEDSGLGEEASKNLGAERVQNRLGWGTPEGIEEGSGVFGSSKSALTLAARDE